MSNNNILNLAYRYHTIGSCVIPSGGGPKEGIANLRNKRYVVGSELQDGRRLHASERVAY